MARTLEKQFIQERAYSILKNVYGPGAQFHPGQLDAIVSVFSGRRGPLDIGLGTRLPTGLPTRLEDHRRPARQRHRLGDDGHGERPGYRRH